MPVPEGEDGAACRSQVPESSPRQQRLDRNPNRLRTCSSKSIDSSSVGNDMVIPPTNLEKEPNEEEFLWRAADTKTVLTGTAALTSMEF
jgi:hypothetical protein